MNKLFLILGIALAVASCNKDFKEPDTLPDIKDSIPDITDLVYPKESDSIIIMTGCDSLPEAVRFDNIPEHTGLAGTKWKLWGALDVATCKLSLLRPRACEECFTLNFITDSTALGRSTSLPITLNIRKEGSGIVKS